MDYRDKLQHLRIYNDLSQQEIADICGVSPKAVSSWERKQNELTVRNLVRLCEYYKISMNSLMDLPEYPPIKPLW